MADLAPDVNHTYALIGLAVLAAAAYTVRVAFWGRARFERVDRQGGSLLLGKNLMEGCYWSLEPFGKLLVWLHISPHVITWASGVFGIWAGIELARGSFGRGSVLATIAAFCDTLDGMVARLSKVASNTGEVLDASLDRCVEFFFLAGLVYYYRDVPWALTLALLAILGSFLVSYSSAKAEAFGVDPPAGYMRRPERGFYLILGAALSPISIWHWEPVGRYAVPLGYPMIVTLAMVALLSNVAAAQRFVAIARLVRSRAESTEGVTDAR